MSIRPIITSKSGKGKSGWLWMPISLALNALSPGGIHLAATAPADQGPKPPDPNAAQTASAASSSARQSTSGRQKKNPDPVKPAANHPAILRADDQPVAVPADLPRRLRNPDQDAADRIGAEAGAGKGAVEWDDGSPIEGMPDGAPGLIPAGAQEEPLYDGFSAVCNPALIESSRVPPSYPELARQAGVQGKVLLGAVIRMDGTVGNVTVLESSGARLGFDEAAVKAVSRWRYKPGLQDGRPVDTQVTILVDFSPPH